MLKEADGKRNVRWWARIFLLLVFLNNHRYENDAKSLRTFVIINEISNGNGESLNPL
jgi:hypothetical protein